MPETKEHLDSVEETSPGPSNSTFPTRQRNERMTGRNEERHRVERSEASSANRGKASMNIRLANLERGTAIGCRPDQSGNPPGRPRRAAWAHACRTVLSAPVPGDRQARTFAEVIAETVAWKAVRGDLRAAQELADRAEGRPRQSIPVDRSTLREAFDRMTDEEMMAYAVSGQLPAWFPELEGGEG